VDGRSLTSYGILRDLDDSAAFAEALRERDGIRIAYIVTDDEGRYQQVADEVRGVETVRLYEDYLRNCEVTGTSDALYLEGLSGRRGRGHAARVTSARDFYGAQASGSRRWR